MNSFGKIFGAYLIGGLLYVKHERQIKIKRTNEKTEDLLKNIAELKEEEMEMNNNNEYEFLSRHYNGKHIKLLPGAKEYASEILSKEITK